MLVKLIEKGLGSSKGMVYTFLFIYFDFGFIVIIFFKVSGEKVVF